MYKSNTEIKKKILEEFENNHQVIEFIDKYFNFKSDSNFINLLSSSYKIESLKNKSTSNIINLKRINDIRYINKFFEKANLSLCDHGLLFGYACTYHNRKQAILEKYPPIFNWFIYIFDTLFNRVLPKLKLTKKLYFSLTKGKGRVLSKAEIFGRLYSCGFKIIDEQYTDNNQYFLAKKVKEPNYDFNPSYGPIAKLKRIGKNNKEIFVRKLRTMHPFSEYIQEYIFDKNNLKEGGKIKNDFRVTPEGKFLRKFWIDELPMIYNILRGDIKLVGVRPLSTHFLSLYPKELQKLRSKFKPGFIPPYYVDLPSTLDEIIKSEIKYLKLCEKNEFRTDLKYFFLAFKNVLFKGARSN